jgi:hypothetical protein
MTICHIFAKKMMSCASHASTLFASRTALLFAAATIHLLYDDDAPIMRHFISRDSHYRHHHPSRQLYLCYTG